MDKEDVKLAYGVTYSSGTKGYFGAILITDYKGFPLEFRYTDPIVPTKIQQVLYGEGLPKYLKIDVITDSLIKALTEDITVLFVEDDDLLKYNASEFPIVRVLPTQAVPLSEPGDTQKIKNNEVLLQTSYSKNPVRLNFKQDFECEGDLFNSIISTLVEAGTFMDVDEPLNRVQKTLELIANDEV